MKVHLVNHNNSFIEAVESSCQSLKMQISLSEGVEEVITELQNNNSNIVLFNWTKGDFDISK